MMKTLCQTLLLVNLLVIAGCDKENEGDNLNPIKDEKGYIQGVVTDTKGEPLKGASITVDNTLIPNSNLLATTDSKGQYKVKLSGSFTWAAYAEFDKQYNGKTYAFDLHPEEDEEFTSDGGISNFQWKLTGQKPVGNTFYGSTIQLQSAIGSPILAQDVTFQLTPIGTLIDGSTGKVLTLKGGAPNTQAYFKLMNIPLGRYKIKATYNGSSLMLKNVITNDTNTELTLDFEPEITVAGGWCENCALIEYK